MSKCMTIDEAIDQKDTFLEVTPKRIIDSVLEEILVSVHTSSDKSCDRIGDFNINEDFCQQFSQPLPVKDFEQANVNLTPSASNLYSNINKERPDNTTESPLAEGKPAAACNEIREDILTEKNEQLIKSKQSLIEEKKSSLEIAREEYYQKEDVIKDEKIEIEYFNQGKLNKIYVPLNEPPKEANAEPQNSPEQEDEIKEELEKKKSKSENESALNSFTPEHLKQSILMVWGNGNSSLVGTRDDDSGEHRERIKKLMEGLSNIEVCPDGSADSYRPRSCLFSEEDVDRVTKEIEAIKSRQSLVAVEDCPPDGQGDADLESKSFTKSKDMLNESGSESRLLPEQSQDDMKKSLEEEVHSTEIREDARSERADFILKEPSTTGMVETSPPSETNDSCVGSQEDQFEKNAPSEEHILESNVQCETNATKNLLSDESLAPDLQLENAVFVESIKENIDYSATGSVDALESNDGIFAEKPKVVSSSSVSGNDILSEFTTSSETGTAQEASKVNAPHSYIEPSTLTKLSASPEETEFVNNSYTSVGESPSDEKEEPTSPDNSVENVEEDEKCFSESSISEVISQVLVTSNTESEVQLRSSESLKTRESSTDSGEISQESEPRRFQRGKFRLHSDKMYSRMGYDPACFQKKNILTRSEEAFIESTESVVQILEPAENSQDDDSVSLLLMPEETDKIFQKPSTPTEVHSTPDVDINNEDQFRNEIAEKKVYSGMTTIGPMKNTEYDPKDLTTPDIDFGKMTRITSSRQLAKDINLLGTDLTSTTAVTILEENYSNESVSENDNDCLETPSFVNRDIASLTKVQKVREVMSHQPKSQEDFEDEETLPKPRLDLKDVESTTDERCKVPDVSIPHLSFEVTSETTGTDVEVEKQLIESLGLIISGLTEPFYENLEENNEYEDNSSLTENAESAEAKKEVQSVKDLMPDKIEKDVDPDFNSQEVISESRSKCETLSGVIKKASSRFMKKESDILLRNSKSLPRDTSKLLTTDSIRSILDDCSASASNVLKKSRSMLRNTQSLFKTISQNRMSTDSGLDKQKMSPSESDVSTVERKLSFLKREDFTKAKNLIKSTMEKTFKRQENSSETDIEQAEPSKDGKELTKTNEKLQVDRMENFKRWLPKSPLVYKSQFVKNQTEMKDTSSEADTGSKGGDDETMSAPSELTTAANDEAVTIQVVVNKIEETLQQEQNEEAVEEFNIDDYLDIIKEETESDYIVMETVQGLPTSDLESPSSEVENVGANITFQEPRKKSDHKMKKIESQVVKEKEVDIVPEGMETEVASKTPWERKIVTKKKKFSTRLRNFWCSAFGRAKIPPKKEK